MTALIGEVAALLAAVAFSATSVCYTVAGRRIDAVTSIAMSLPLSWLLMLGIHQATLGTPFPFGVALDRWFFLSASGLLAFVVSQFFMLRAYQHIGPRLTMLVASFAPVLGALLAWLFLGQTLPPNATLGILVVIVGIVWVVVDRGKGRTAHLERDIRRGVIFASLGTLAQATAFVFSSQGVAGDFPPFSATLIRITAGIVALWVLIAVQGRLRVTATVFNGDGRLFALLAGAALSGPVIAGSLLLLSFQHAPVGVATTLSHTTAIILIPVGYYLFKERITLQAVVGTFVTIIGIGILFI